MRKTSAVTDTDFPFADDSTPFILVTNGIIESKESRGFEHASTYEKKYGLLERAIQAEADGYYGEGSGSVSLLAIWPGARRSDVFLVDDLEGAKEAMG